MKDLLKYGFYLILVAIPSYLILGAVVYWLVPDFFNDVEHGDNRGYIGEYYNILPYEIHYEDDTIRISTINLPSEKPYIPGITEVWRVNKLTGDSSLCVKSNPNYFGRGRDSIPSIVNVWYNPYRENLIVEGPTCHAGTMATYIVDAVNGESICLPTNNGLVGFTNWDDYLIASSKFNDIDYDLALWYENIYILDWEGEIISYSTTKEAVMEDALPLIHHDANLNVMNIKLDNHIQLSPQYPDSLFYGNEYQVSYSGPSIKEIEESYKKGLLDDGWTKHGDKYLYYYDDFEVSDTDSPNYGSFLTIVVDSKRRTGIVRKGAYSNPLNKQKKQFE